MQHAQMRGRDRRAGTQVREVRQDKENAPAGRSGHDRSRRRPRRRAQLNGCAGGQGREPIEIVECGGSFVWIIVLAALALLAGLGVFARLVGWL